MASGYSTRGKRTGSRDRARRPKTCVCGRKVLGEREWSSHKRACVAWHENHLDWLGLVIAEAEAVRTIPPAERDAQETDTVTRLDRWRAESQLEQVWIAGHGILPDQTV